MSHYPKIFDFTGSGGGSFSIDLNEIAFGTGTGITSSTTFTFDNVNINLLASTASQLDGSCFSAIVAGSTNTVEYSCSSFVLGGYSNTLTCNSNYSSIIGGKFNTISSTDTGGLYSGHSVIIGGSRNKIYNYSNYSIVSGYYNIIATHSCSTSIIGGFCNRVNCSKYSSIIGGYQNEIYKSEKSVILGGSSLKLSSEDEVVYVPTLKIATASLCNSSNMILVRGDNGIVGYRESTTMTGVSGSFLPLAGSTASSLMQGPIEANGNITFDILQRDSNSAVALRMNGSGSIEMFSGECNRSVGIRFGSTDPDYWDLSGCSYITSQPPTLRSKCGNIELSGVSGDQYIFGGSFSGGRKQGLLFDHSVKCGGPGTSLTIFQTDNNTDFGIINVRNNRVIIGQGTSLTASKQFDFQLDKCNFIIGSHSETSTNCGSIISGYDHSFGESDNSSLIGGLKNVLYGKNKGSSIIAGCQNKLDAGQYNTIIGSKNSEVYLSYVNTIASGYKSCIYNKSSESFIGGSFKSRINRGSNSAIIASKSSQISNGGNTVYSSVILSSVGNTIAANYSAVVASPNSVIGAGYNNFISGGSGNTNYGYNSAIIGGYFNQVGLSQSRAALIGGLQNIISTYYGLGCNSVIIGGYQNVMKGACNSAIIGGQSLSLYNNDTVLVQNLWIAGTVSPDNGVAFGTSGTFFIGSATFSICNGIITNIEQ